MRLKSGQLGLEGLVLGVILLLGGPPVWASHEAFAVYEDWTTARNIRADRWQGNELFGGQEIKREVVKRGKQSKLSMRFRKGGVTVDNAGTRTSSNILGATNASLIDQIEADVTVKRVTIAGCAANANPSRARPFLFSVALFNDGSSANSADKTGNHFAVLQAFRNSNSADASGVLEVAGTLLRCSDPGCNSFTVVSGPLTLPETVNVGVKFTLREIWDSPNNQVLFGVGANPNVALTYSPSLNVASAVLPFATMEVRQTAANCTADATTVDAETEVSVVRTNTSAVIP